MSSIAILTLLSKSIVILRRSDAKAIGLPKGLTIRVGTFAQHVPRDIVNMFQRAANLVIEGHCERIGINAKAIHAKVIVAIGCVCPIAFVKSACTMPAF